MAGLIGNQINYLLFDYVPDMIHLPFLGGVIFNVADIWAFVAMAVLFVRLAFFEGKDFVDWLGKHITQKKAKPEQGKKKRTARQKAQFRAIPPERAKIRCRRIAKAVRGSECAGKMTKK